MSDLTPHDLERLRKQDFFNRRINAFIERYCPRSYEGRDFDIELRGLIMTAYELAQEPFAYELRAYRDNAVDAAMLRPINVRT
jgi:hypothetical protein